jgi:hypothetical protein
VNSHQIRALLLQRSMVKKTLSIAAFNPLTRRPLLRCAAHAPVRLPALPWR